MLGLSDVGMKTTEKYAQWGASDERPARPTGSCGHAAGAKQCAGCCPYLPATQTRQMLGGLVSWTWAQLDKTCTVFGKEPGKLFSGPDLAARHNRRHQGGSKRGWRRTDSWCARRLVSSSGPRSARRMASRGSAPVISLYPPRQPGAVHRAGHGRALASRPALRDRGARRP